METITTLEKLNTESVHIKQVPYVLVEGEKIFIEDKTHRVALVNSNAGRQQLEQLDIAEQSKDAILAMWGDYIIPEDAEHGIY